MSEQPNHNNNDRIATDKRQDTPVNGDTATGERSRRGILSLLAVIPLAGCGAIPSTKYENTTQTTGQKQADSTPDRLAIPKVEVARQYDRIGVRGIIEHDNGSPRDGGCIRVSLYKNEKRAFTETIHATEDNGEWSHFVHWWDVEPETADRDYDPKAELIGSYCDNE